MCVVLAYLACCIGYSSHAKVANLKGRNLFYYVKSSKLQKSFCFFVVVFFLNYFHPSICSRNRFPEPKVSVRSPINHKS